MISEKMVEMVNGSSAIREMFEAGQRMAQKYGKENIYDFTLGNPSVPAPDGVNKAFIEVVKEEESTFLHGYMNNLGYEDVREKIAVSINNKFTTDFTHENIVMTVGAAGGLNVIFKSLLNPNDEVIVFAPFFGEYANYISSYEGKMVVISADTETFQPNLKEFKAKINEKTKAVIINSPNNPTGVVYSEKVISDLTDILRRATEELSTEIYLIADEPYRELVYDGVEVPYLTKYYDNTIVGYSFSKSLSLPGERIGYVVIPSEVTDFEQLMVAVATATRIMGFVNAPSLQQRVIAKCLDLKTDIDQYNRNREALYGGLIDAGFECVKPQGAFYLFVKSPIDDDKEFCQLAKSFKLLIVPGSAFGCPGFVRLAYCVDYDMIMRGLPKFKELMEYVKKNK